MATSLVRVAGLGVVVSPRGGAHVPSLCSQLWKSDHTVPFVSVAFVCCTRGRNLGIHGLMPEAFWGQCPLRDKKLGSPRVGSAHLHQLRAMLGTQMWPDVVLLPGCCWGPHMQADCYYAGKEFGRHGRQATWGGIRILGERVS